MTAIFDATLPILLAIEELQEDIGVRRESGDFASADALELALKRFQSCVTEDAFTSSQQMIAELRAQAANVRIDPESGHVSQPEIGTRKERTLQKQLAAAAISIIVDKKVAKYGTVEKPNIKQLAEKIRGDIEAHFVGTGHQTNCHGLAVSTLSENLTQGMKALRDDA